jgi:hypothetical protein
MKLVALTGRRRCGDDLDGGAGKADEGDCTMPCAGDATEICGAGMRLSLFSNNQWSPPSAATLQGYEYQGCYVDALGPRALSDSVIDDAMTPANCAQLCSGKAYMGLEFGE